jgi:light-regulated signal transduction histidine kinase (bacteriophytochrome)
MAGATESDSSCPQSVPEAAVRTLRHEVGDLLQTVYATAALLQHRLPAGWELERRILTDMRARGEACRVLLDLAHDLVCPMRLTCEPTNWKELLAPVLTVAAERHPALRIEPTWQDVPQVFADIPRLEQVCRLALAEVCGGAAHRVDMTLSSANNGKQVHWRITRDGDTLPAQDLENYFRPGRAGTNGPSSIGMVLARRIVELHGGQITADSPDDGALRITIALPGPLGRSERKGT